MERDEMRRIDDAVRDAIGAGDLDALDELMAPDLAAGVRDAVGALREAFPDYGGTNELQIVDGDWMATRWRYHGTHRGEYLGVAPTGQRVEFTGISMSRFANGRMVESIVEFDDAAVLRQLGALDQPPS